MGTRLVPNPSELDVRSGQFIAKMKRACVLVTQKEDLVELGVRDERSKESLDKTPFCAA